MYAQKQLFAYANSEYISEADAGWLASGLARVSCAFIRGDGVQLGTLRACSLLIERLFDAINIFCAVIGVFVHGV